MRGLGDDSVNYSYKVFFLRLKDFMSPKERQTIIDAVLQLDYFVYYF